MLVSSTYISVSYLDNVFMGEVFYKEIDLSTLKIEVKFTGNSSSSWQCNQMEMFSRTIFIRSRGGTGYLDLS